MNRENNTIDKKKQSELEGLELKHRAERLSTLTGKNFNAEYFSKIHNRSTQLVYQAWSGNAPSLRKKMSLHLDYLEEKYMNQTEEAAA